MLNFNTCNLLQVRYFNARQKTKNLFGSIFKIIYSVKTLGGCFDQNVAKSL